MRSPNFHVPTVPVIASRSLVLSGLLVVGCTLIVGCNKAPAPVASAPASTGTLQQQVQNDPNISPEKKQQIADSLARSQAAANDPRNLAGRPTPTSR